MSSRRSNGAKLKMQFCRRRFAILIAAGLFAASVPCARATEPIEIFDAHLHYNWEPKPFYQLDEVLALFKKHRVTGTPDSGGPANAFPRC